MRRLFLVVGTAVVILPWLAGARAQADAIHWTASASLLEPTSEQIYPQNGGGTGIISLFPGKATSGTNSGTLDALVIAAAADPDRMTTPTFGGPSANYSLSLALHDDASESSGSLTFRGNLSGSIRPDNSVNLKNTFLGSTTQTLRLGGNLYTVKIGPFVSPTYLGDLGDGSISASIALQPADHSAPEPSSLVLACLGLPPLGLAGWLRRRHRRKGVDRNASKA